MNELTQEQKLRQFDDILGNVVRLGQEIINDCSIVEGMKFNNDFLLQNRCMEIYDQIKHLTTLNKGN